MTTAVVDSLENQGGLVRPLLAPSVVDHRCASETGSVVLEMTSPVISAPARQDGVRPKRRREHLIARWIPDPRREQALICIWVPRIEGRGSAAYIAP